MIDLSEKESKVKQQSMENYLLPIDRESDDIVSVYDELPLWSAPFGLTLLDAINYSPISSIMDIASGTGFPLFEIARRFGGSTIVYGIDPWETAVNRVRFKKKIYNIKNVEIIRGIAEKLPFHDECFDLITSNNGLNNVDNIQDCIGEISRVSKNGAQFIFTVNTNKTMPLIYEVFERILKSLNLLESIELMKKHITKMRKPFSFYKDILLKNNFKIVDKIDNKFHINFANGKAILDHFFFRFYFIVGWKSFLEEKNYHEVFSMFETKLDKIAFEQGGIRLEVPYYCVCTKKIWTC